eukprot:4981233-Ditylum_brightwellii.AAC.1
MSVSGYSGRNDAFSVTDCSYLACRLPTCMLEVCGDEGCTNYLHHSCMVEYQEEKEKHAMKMGIYTPMFKRNKSEEQKEDLAKDDLNNQEEE